MSLVSWQIVTKIEYSHIFHSLAGDLDLQLPDEVIQETETETESHAFAPPPVENIPFFWGEDLLQPDPADLPAEVDVDLSVRILQLYIRHWKTIHTAIHHRYNFCFLGLEHLREGCVSSAGTQLKKTLKQEMKKD